MQVEDDLERIMNATSQQGLMDGFKALGKSIGELEQLAAKRQAVSEHSLPFLRDLSRLGFVFLSFLCYCVLQFRFLAICGEKSNWKWKCST